MSLGTLATHTITHQTVTTYGSEMKQYRLGIRPLQPALITLLLLGVITLALQIT